MKQARDERDLHEEESRANGRQDGNDGTTRPQPSETRHHRCARNHEGDEGNAPRILDIMVAAETACVAENNEHDHRVPMRPISIHSRRSKKRNLRFRSTRPAAPDGALSCLLFVPDRGLEEYQGSPKIASACLTLVGGLEIV